MSDVLVVSRSLLLRTIVVLTQRWLAAPWGTSRKYRAWVRLSTFCGECVRGKVLTTQDTDAVIIEVVTEHDMTRRMD